MGFNPLDKRLLRSFQYKRTLQRLFFFRQGKKRQSNMLKTLNISIGSKQFLKTSRKIS